MTKLEVETFELERRLAALEVNRVRIDAALLEERTRAAGQQMIDAFTHLKETTEAPVALVSTIEPLRPAGRVSLLTPRRWAFWTTTAITIMGAKPFGMPWNWLPGLWCVTFSLLSMAIGHPWGSPRRFPGTPTPLGRLAGPCGPPCEACACQGNAGVCRHGGLRLF